MKDEIKILHFDKKCEEHSQIKSIKYIKYSYLSIFFFSLLVILTGGIILLSLSWFSFLKYIFLYQYTDYENACKVMVQDNENEYSYLNLTYDKSSKRKLFECKLYKYIQIQSTNQYIPVKFNPSSSSLDEENLMTYMKFNNKYSKGLSSDDVIRKRFKYGKCNLDFKINSYIKLIYIEISDPFYLFQIGSVILWFCNSYEKYAAVILVTTVFSLLYSVWETKQNLLSIQKMSKYSVEVNAFREGKVLKIQSHELVPGDIYIPPNEGLQVPADSIILSGNVICNEALLTGESTPIIKENIPNSNDKFSVNNNDIDKYMIYAGTKVIQKRGKCKVVVISTGFNTEKGSLVRSILYPKKIKIAFQFESVKFIIIMFILGIIGYIINIVFMIKQGLSAGYIVLKFLDLLTIVVPPALPTCLTIGISIASKKLTKYGIRCIDRNRINIAGYVNLISFDKTGTLTEDSLEIVGFKQNKLTSKGYEFSLFDIDIRQLSEDISKKVNENYLNQEKKNDSIEYNSFLNHCKFKEDYNGVQQMIYDYFHNKIIIDRLFIECLATCHALTKKGETLLGDPIDVEMFKKSNWKLIQNDEINDDNDIFNINTIQNNENNMKKYVKSTFNIGSNDYEIEIIKLFNFSSKLQRMTVICKNKSDSDIFIVFSKGSPEKIRELSIKETYPSNYDEILDQYTSKGYRVLSLSAKIIKATNIIGIERSKLESQMIFLGLMIIQNKLKPETIPTIKELNDCKIKMVMATGDNILTAIAVSKESTLINGNGKVYSCLIEKEKDEGKLKKAYMKWDIITDKEVNKEEEDFLKVLNNTYREVVDGNNNEIQKKENDDKEIIGGNSIIDKSILKRISFKRNSSFLHVENMEDLKKYYNHINIVNEEELIENIELRNENLVQVEKQGDKNEDDYVTNIDNTVISFKESSHSKKFKDSDIQLDDYIVTNGYTLQKLYELSNSYIKTKDESLKIFYETLRVVLRRGIVFARMSPYQKSILVQSFQKEGFNVLMCGDGANDCAALKAANVGMSLSQEEASIAAPFTSMKANISCLIVLFRECKSSLVTSFQCFKFMIFYSLIQFISIIIHNSLNSYLQDYQFLLSDLFIVLPMVILLERTEASKKLTKDLPTSSLISFSVILSILSHLVIIVLFQVASYLLLTIQSFYDSTITHCGFDEDDVPLSCDINTSVFLVSNLQYYVMIFVIVIEWKFKRPFITNIAFIIYTIGTMTYMIFMIFKRDNLSRDILGLIDFDYNIFNLYIFFIVLVNFVVSFFFEFVINRFLCELYLKWSLNKKLRNVNNDKATLCEINQALTGVVSY